MLFLTLPLVTIVILCLSCHAIERLLKSLGSIYMDCHFPFLYLCIRRLVDVQDTDELFSITAPGLNSGILANILIHSFIS